ncbi:MAG: LysM peptidoglycan-binding domain-containing protein [ANME-2 cluster archaeon]|nr:LysM peptidoglycan-binding domain-containing protein [ANME-2 cluster archaeon]
MAGSATSSKEKKAHIIVLNLQGKKKDVIPVCFNPADYSLDKSNQYQDTSIPGLQSPVTQFVSGGAQTLTLELFFDTYEKQKDVREYTKKIDALVNIDPDIHAPPVCKFVWGGLEFKAVVEKVTKKFTMFLSDGIPVRATLNLTFKEYKTVEEQLQEIRRQSSDRTKVRTVHEGDSLWSIAAVEYGDQGEWRHIARANKIVNPRILLPGTLLEIPPLE